MSSAGSPSSRRMDPKWSSMRVSPTRPPRSVGHSIWPRPRASAGRISVIHSSRHSAAQPNTLKTLRCFGAEPFIALPCRT